MSRDAFIIRRGLPARLEATAAALYWESFRGKLVKLMGSDARGIGFFTECLI